MVEIPKSKARGIENASPLRIDSTALFTSGREVIVVHKDAEYRLRLTSNDKLILTK